MLRYHIMIDSGSLFEVLTKLMKFLIDDILLLLDVIFDNIFFFLQWERNIDKFVHIIFIYSFSFQKLYSWDPLVPFVLCCTSKLDCSCILFSDAFSCVLSDGYVEVICWGLHHGFWDFEDVFDFDDTKGLFVWLILLDTMEPWNILWCKNQKTLWDVLIGLLTLLETEVFVKDDFVVVFNEHALHLFDDKPILLLKRQLTLWLAIFSNQNMLPQLFNLYFNCFLIHHRRWKWLDMFCQHLMEDFLLVFVEHNLVNAFT